MKKLSLNQESTNYTNFTLPTRKQITVVLAVLMIIGTVGRAPHAFAKSLDEAIDQSISQAQAEAPKPEALSVDIGPTIAAYATKVEDMQALPHPAKEKLPEAQLQQPPAPAPAPAPDPKPVIRQASAVTSVKPVSGGGYPYANAPFPNSSVDPWGMYKRQCVSYAAWKVSASGRNMPYWGGKGSAYMWDENARAAGIPVDANPRVGDVAVKNSGSGHVMYVEAVYGDGTIKVSDYNNDGRGTYGERVRSAAGLVFIHF